MKSLAVHGGPKVWISERTEMSTGSEGPSTDSHSSNKKCGLNFFRLIVDFFRFKKKCDIPWNILKVQQKQIHPENKYCAHNPSFWASWVVSEHGDYECSFKGSTTYSQTSVLAYTAMWFWTESLDLLWPASISSNLNGDITVPAS